MVKEKKNIEKFNKAFWDWFGDSKVVNEDGSPKVVYHGTPQGDFSIFKPYMLFTENKEYADHYQSTSASSRNFDRKLINPKTYSVYLKIEKPFDTRSNKKAQSIWEEFLSPDNGTEYYSYGMQLTEKGLPGWMEADNLTSFLEEKGYNKQFDGLLLDEGGIGGYDIPVTDRGISYMPFSPNQIKSATENDGSWDSDDDSILSEKIENSKKQIENSKITPKFNKAFWDWFGDSKVVNDDGSPKVVYHGTTRDFSEFKIKERGSHTKTLASKKGFFFTDDENEADCYTGYEGSSIYPVFLSIKNPHITDHRRYSWYELRVSGKANQAYTQAINYAIKHNKDGVIIYSTIDCTAKRATIYIVFSPNQIKSATGNDGSWDADDASILSDGDGITYVLYGTKEGGKYEDLIVETRDKAKLGNAKKWAEGNNFKKLRVIEYQDGVYEKPDFVKAIADDDSILSDLFNKYEKEYLGESAIIDGIEYIFKGKSKNSKLYRYEPAPSEINKVREFEELKEKKLDALYIQFNTVELIKLINKKFGGKIEGRSKTTSSVYSKLKNGLKVRVSKHDVMTPRSESDINIFLNTKYSDSLNAYVNDEWVNINPDDKIEAVYDNILTEVEKIIKDSDDGSILSGLNIFSWIKREIWSTDRGQIRFSIIPIDLEHWHGRAENFTEKKAVLGPDDDDFYTYILEKNIDGYWIELTSDEYESPAYKSLRERAEYELWEWKTMNPEVEHADFGKTLFGLEALPISTAKEYTKAWKEAGADKIYEDYFKGENRIYLPVKNLHIDISCLENSGNYQFVSNFLDNWGYKTTEPLYLQGLCYKIDVKTGKRIEMRIGKVLHKIFETKGFENYQKEEVRNVLTRFETDECRELSQIKNELLAVISRHPYDIAGMSTDRGWTSCLNLGRKAYFIMNDKNGFELTQGTEKWDIWYNSKESIKDNFGSNIHSHFIGTLFYDTDRNGIKFRFASSEPDIMQPEMYEKLKNYDFLFRPAGGNPVPSKERKYFKEPQDIIPLLLGTKYHTDITAACNAHYVIEDVKHGTLVAYLINENDRNIEHPLGRVLIKRLMMPKGIKNLYEISSMRVERVIGDKEYNAYLVLGFTKAGQNKEKYIFSKKFNIANYNSLIDYIDYIRVARLPQKRWKEILLEFLYIYIIPNGIEPDSDFTKEEYIKFIENPRHFFIPDILQQNKDLDKSTGYLYAAAGETYGTVTNEFIQVVKDWVDEYNKNAPKGTYILPKEVYPEGQTNITVKGLADKSKYFPRLNELGKRYARLMGSVEKKSEDWYRISNISVDLGQAAKLCHEAEKDDDRYISWYPKIFRWEEIYRDKLKKQAIKKEKEGWETTTENPELIQMQVLGPKFEYNDGEYRIWDTRYGGSTTQAVAKISGGYYLLKDLKNGKDIGYYKTRDDALTKLKELKGEKIPIGMGKHPDYNFRRKEDIENFDSELESYLDIKDYDEFVVTINKIHDVLDEMTARQKESLKNLDEFYKLGYFLFFKKYPTFEKYAKHEVGKTYHDSFGRNTSITRYDAKKDYDIFRRLASNHNIELPYDPEYDEVEIKKRDEAEKLNEVTQSRWRESANRAFRLKKKSEGKANLNEIISILYKTSGMIEIPEYQRKLFKEEMEK